MALKTSRLPLSLHAAATLEKELQALQETLRDKPLHEYASSPGVIALLALNDVRENPSSYSYTYGEAASEYRFADTYGWRLILKIGNNSAPVQVLHLYRITDPKISVSHTLRQMRQDQTPPQTP